MKVGTDGVLLGAWTNCEKAKNILDIGTGTGLIALMMAQRTTAHIVGCEINSLAHQEASKNFQQSKWKERLESVNTSIQELKTDLTFDLIVSNPPFFNINHKHSSRKQSRQQDQLTHLELIQSATSLLTPDGNFDVILPFIEGEAFIKKCESHQLFLSRKCYVYGRSNGKCKRLLLSFTKQSSALKINELTIEKHNRHDYTEAYKSLTKDFYLNF